MIITTRLTGDTGRIAIAAALLVSLAIAIIGCLIGAGSVGTPSAAAAGGPGPIGGEAANFWELFVGVVGRNAAAAALLFSGVITAGVSTVLTLGLTSAYIGATFAGAVAQVGAGEVIGSIWIYAPLEFTAILLSAGAGLLPLAGLLLRSWRAERAGGWFADYSRSLGVALRLFAGAFVLLIIAAAAEAAVVTSR